MMSLFTPQSGEERLFSGQFFQFFDDIVPNRSSSGENSPMKEFKLTKPHLVVERSTASKRSKAMWLV
jgi:hypothetical protein